MTLINNVVYVVLTAIISDNRRFLVLPQGPKALNSTKNTAVFYNLDYSRLGVIKFLKINFTQLSLYCKC